MAALKEIHEIFLYPLRQDASPEEFFSKTRNAGGSLWQDLYDLAVKSRLFAVFFARLLPFKCDCLPADFIDKLRNIYLLNLKRNLLLKQEIVRVLGRFGKSDIDAMPIKGPILAGYLYQDMGLRQASCDLDLLVKREKIDQAKEELKGLGYSLSLIEKKRDFLQPLGLTGKVEQAVMTRALDEEFNVAIDLHWCVRGFYSQADIRQLWAQGRNFDLEGQRFLIPGHEDYVIYLSLISVSGLESVQLRYLYDLHTLIVRYNRQLDWNALLDKALARPGLQNSLYFPLKLCRDLFSTNLPEEFIARITPDWTTRRIVSLFLNEGASFNRDEGGGKNLLMRLTLARFLYAENGAEFFTKASGRFFKETLRRYALTV